jgi:hypothetical protein
MGIKPAHSSGRAEFRVIHSALALRRETYVRPMASAEHRPDDESHYPLEVVNRLERTKERTSKPDGTVYWWGTEEVQPAPPLIGPSTQTSASSARATRAGGPPTTSSKRNRHSTSLLSTRVGRVQAPRDTTMALPERNSTGACITSSRIIPPRKWPSSEPSCARRCRDR